MSDAKSNRRHLGRDAAGRAAARGARGAGHAHCRAGRAIKVPPRKLEALEADRYDELPDCHLHARAGADRVPGLEDRRRRRCWRVCRRPAPTRLGAVGQRPEHAVPRARRAGASRGGVRAVAGGRCSGRRCWCCSPRCWRLPDAARWLASASALATARDRSIRPSVAGARRRTAVEPRRPAVHAVQPRVAGRRRAAQVTCRGAGSGAGSRRQLRPQARRSLPRRLQRPAQAVWRCCAVHESWIEVIDAAGRSLLSRTVQPGESVGLDGACRCKVKIGNARRPTGRFRGQPVNLRRSRATTWPASNSNDRRRSQP